MSKGPSNQPAPPVRRRLVFMLPGFERVKLEGHYLRFVREAKKTAPSYDMSVDCSEPQYSEGDCPTAAFTYATAGDGWRSEADVIIYGLGRLNEIYDRRGMLARLFGGLFAQLDIELTGTAFRYLRHGWRFFLFFLFPPFFVALWIASALVAILPPLWLGMVHGLWSVPAGGGIAALLYFDARRLHLLLTMDLWTATSDVARGCRADIQRVLQSASDDIVRRIADTDAEEVIVVGHSFGVIPAVMALADGRVVKIAHERPVGLLASGSFLLAVADHPAAKSLRAAVTTILNAPMAWLDAQSHTDPVNFFRTNPADALKIKTDRKPAIVEVRFKNQLTSESYRKIRGDFFRTHRQFVFGVEKRSHYSLFAIVGGPEAFSEVVKNKGLSGDWSRYETGWKTRHEAGLSS